MSVEGSPQNKQEELKRQEALLDGLLDKLPAELQDVWFGKIDGLPITEQIETIERVLAVRREKKNQYHSPTLLPKGVEIFESFPDDVREIIETLRTSERTIEIGYGKAGHVIAHPAQPEICYKILFDDELLPACTNDIATETDLQQEIHDVFDGNHGVLVPKVFAFISEPGTRAITMELLNGPSLRQVLEHKVEHMPEAFDESTFFAALRAFVLDMNEKGYYHRDLHAGNVLVHRETGLPCVIDFGLSKKTTEDTDMYKEQTINNGHFVEVVLQSDTENIQKMKKEVRAYQSNRE